MNAYMVMVEEALAQLPDPRAVTLVVMQGSIAAAIFTGFAKLAPPQLPRSIIAEPSEADCLYRSAAAQQPTPSSGTQHAIMAGLACRAVSPAAWKILQWLASDFVAIPDDLAIEAMRAPADGGQDIPIVSGESAAGGMASCSPPGRPALRDQLG